MSQDPLRQVGAADGYLPPQDDLTAPWWDATRECRLLLQRCDACGSVQHHPRYVCTSCGSTDRLGWVGCSGAGAVDSFTVVHRPPRPDLVAPYVVARIRLDDGPVLLSHLVLAEQTDARIGARVSLSWAALSDGRHLPVFTPEESP